MNRSCIKYLTCAGCCLLDDESALVNLDAMLAEIPDSMPTLMGIPIDKFDRDDLIKLCKLFANEWRNAENKYLDALKRMF